MFLHKGVFMLPTLWQIIIVPVETIVTVILIEI